MAYSADWPRRQHTITWACTSSSRSASCGMQAANHRAELDTTRGPAGTRRCTARPGPSKPNDGDRGHETSRQRNTSSQAAVTLGLPRPAADQQFVPER